MKVKVTDTEQTIENVLESYVGSQINLDSKVARVLLAKEIAEALGVASKSKD